MRIPKARIHIVEQRVWLTGVEHVRLSRVSGSKLRILSAQADVLIRKSVVLLAQLAQELRSALAVLLPALAVALRGFGVALFGRGVRGGWASICVRVMAMEQLLASADALLQLVRVRAREALIATIAAACITPARVHADYCLNGDVIDMAAICRPVTSFLGLERSHELDHLR